MTATIIWPLLSAFSEQLPNPDTGLIAAGRPWTGHFKAGRSLWAMAHTAQFAQPGWHYMDSSSVKLAGGGTIVALRHPEGSDWSAVIETDQAAAAQRVRLTIGEGLDAGQVSVWSTDLRSQDSARWFERLDYLEPSAAREIEIALQPGRVYSISTAAGQGKGETAAPDDERLALPYREDFDGAERGHSPPFFSDIEGAFEVEPCGGGRAGGCLRQQITRLPVPWFAPPAPWISHPRTLIGDPQWWGDYEVAADVMFEQAGVAEIGGRLGRQVINNFELPGIWARITSAGAWKLYRQDWEGALVPLAAGAAGPLGTKAWHRVSLRFEGAKVDLVIDGRRVGGASDSSFRIGSAGLGLTLLAHVQFDNFSVTPLGGRTELLPPRSMTATSPAAGAEAVLDDNLGTVWSAGRNVPLTLDLGAARTVSGLVYQPRAEQNPAGVAVGYTVDVSTDGQSFEQVASGNWIFDLSPKAAAWQPRQARYVRFAGGAADGGIAASELRVAVPGSD